MSLYREILRKKYDDLAPLVQEMHDIDEKRVLTGHVTIKKGQSFTARVMNIVMRLPKSKEKAELRLEQSRNNENEVWKRTFGKETFSSVQFRCKENMVEKMGPIKMYFDLWVEDNALCTRLEKTTFLGIKLPKVLSSTINSNTKEHEGAISFFVEVCSPRGMLIIEYAGVIIDIEKDSVQRI